MSVCRFNSKSKYMKIFLFISISISKSRHLKILKSDCSLVLLSACCHYTGSGSLCELFCWFCVTYLSLHQTANSHHHLVTHRSRTFWFLIQASPLWNNIDLRQSKIIFICSGVTFIKPKSQVVLFLDIDA